MSPADQALWIASGIGLVMVVGALPLLRLMSWISRKEIERDRARGLPVD